MRAIANVMDVSPSLRGRIALLMDLCCVGHAGQPKMATLMKVLFAILCLGLAAVTFNLSAQVSVELSLDQKQFLPGEDLPVTVRVTNRSGQSLHLGESGWLTFFIQSDNGTMVSEKLGPPVKDPFDLDNGEMGIKTINLAPYFNLQRTGTYHVTATVHIPAWNTDLSTSAQSFDIIEGAQLWSQSFGVSDPQTPNQPPNVREYTLVEANYLRSQLRLYVQVTDEADGTILKVHSLGPMISFSQPEAQLDHDSNLHVLCQTGAATFTHSVLNPNGALIKQEVFDYVNTRPRLTEDTAGNITVLGGVRRMDPREIPPVKAPDQLAR